MHILRKMTLTACLIGFAGIATAVDFSGVPSGAYVVEDTHAYINFQYSHLGLSNPTLGFDEFSVDLNLDNANPEKSTINVTIEAASILTGSKIFYKEMTGDKFFDVANHPQLTFVSTGITPAGDGNYTVAGDLTIKGSTNPVTLDVTINGAKNHPMSGKPVIGLSASGQLVRSAWGLSTAVPHVSDEVTLNINVEMKPK